MNRRAAVMLVIVFAGLVWVSGVTLRAAAADTGAGRSAESTGVDPDEGWFARDATVLTLFDRAGNVLATIGQRDLYRWPILSPDGTRVAVTVADIAHDSSDLWVFELATGKGTRITSHTHRDVEWAGSAVWSPDGRELAYVGMREGYEGIYRKAADGSGSEQLLYRHPGAELWIGDWSPDGSWLSFSTMDYFGGVIYALPMQDGGLREPIEVLRSDAELMAGAFSPEAGYLTYGSDVSGRYEVYLTTFDSSAAAAADAGASQVAARQVSTAGGNVVVRSGWGRGGSEIYYTAPDGRLMTVGVGGDSDDPLEPPKALFRFSQAIPLLPGRVSVSRDGERILVKVPHSPNLEQVTVFDRTGKVLHRVGEPGVYRNPTLSPDGKRVAVTRFSPQTRDTDIWVYDLDSGTGFPVTDDSHADNWPIWSPDGSQIAYRSERGLYASIYLKAADGSGSAEQIFRYTPGAGLQLTDWSEDGRFMSFQDGCWGVLYLVPLDSGSTAEERRSIDWLRDEFQVAQLRFSPDSRFVAYLTDELAADEFQIYVSPFDADQPDVGRGSGQPIRISTERVEGMLGWRADAGELYYLTPDWQVMALGVISEPALQTGKPMRLFDLPGPLPGNTKQWKSVSPDGQRFVFVLNIPVPVSQFRVTPN